MDERGAVLALRNGIRENRDILISSIVATAAPEIRYLARVARWFASEAGKERSKPANRSLRAMETWSARDQGRKSGL